MEFTRCGGNENCQDGQRCMTHTLWNELSEEIFDFLSGISLADLVERGSKNQSARLCAGFGANSADLEVRPA